MPGLFDNQNNQGGGILQGLGNYFNNIAANMDPVYQRQLWERQGLNAINQTLGPNAPAGMGPLMLSNPQAAQTAINQRLLREQYDALSQDPNLAGQPGKILSILQDPAVRQQYYEQKALGNVKMGPLEYPVIGSQGQISSGIPGGQGGMNNAIGLANSLTQQQEAAKALGTAQGTAQGGLPNTQALIDKGLEDIDALVRDPQLKNAVGLRGAILTEIPGTPAQGPAARLAQLHGESSLVGLQYLQKIGRLNINEFNAGANAISRLQQHQSYPDVLEALGDLKKVFQAARSRSGETAGIGPTPAPSAVQSQPTQQPSGGNAPTAINRATGQRVILQNGQWVPIR